jgi:hypothetical protein
LAAQAAGSGRVNSSSNRAILSFQKTSLRSPSVRGYRIKKEENLAGAPEPVNSRAIFRRDGKPKAMEERDYFNETTEQRTHTLTCPKCGQAGEYKVTWIVRRKRPQLPRGADERDRAKFAKAQSYMVRRDEKLACTNIRCRKPFEISSLQSVAFLND